MTGGDEKLRVLLLEAPSAHRDGKQLQLEIEGYDVRATWEVKDALDELPEVAFTYLVIDRTEDAPRWRRLLEPPASPPVLVFSQLSREALAEAGIVLRPKDFCANQRH